MWDQDIIADNRNDNSNSDQNNKDQTKKPVLVLDTNAFIKCLDLQSLYNKYDLYTTQEVKFEIRDKKAREKFLTLPFDILVKDPSKTAVAAVRKFATTTGDIASLSSVDINVIALCYTFAEENKTADLLRKEPPEIKEAFAQKNVQDGLESLTLEEQQQNQNQEQKQEQGEQKELKEDSNENQDNDEDYEDDDQEKKDDKDDDDGWNVVPVKEKKKVISKPKNEFGTGWNFVGPKTNEEKQQQTQEKENVEGEQNKEAVQEQKNQKPKKQKDEESDDEDDGEGWINTENIHLYKEQGNQKLENTGSQIGVSILTADFAMQNVALQMGIPLVSIDGMLITRAKRFILECFGCQHLCKEMTKKFCPKCKNPTLLKVSCSFEADGSIKLYRKKGFKLNTAGFIYSIPKPQIGKQANNIVLREDDLLKGNKLTQCKIAQKQQEKEFSRNMLEFENGFTLDDIKHKQHHNHNLEFGYGRLNPNNVSQMKRHKRK
ncbi:nin one-binding Zn-ribbon-like protein (macronuclear) [Tetrahymena thermophila SB210]|uniref:Nin one-binding Zn-ribbon-like protein n=1 Tax=Tetrahymena thermophila (strain SB210) TaxID=312017 RepID=Q245N9_TETTS|nr:nin one-binding Zn-ribbon-like protein [Tetrahymena thermophila SB210]EAS03594.1 nin one-binding Zn-ribbon-like protein [Tetrahymena thermophila SB210]|eukprot:XP_001023839.1 nin one-binding Zn-ribbon-like protein [Tetrahymena thermophila SB210]